MTSSWSDKAKLLHFAMKECEADEQLEHRLGPEFWRLVSHIGLEKLWEMHRLDFAAGGKVSSMLLNAEKQLEGK